MANEFAMREVSRWMRPDAHRFLRPDWRRWVRDDSELATVLTLYEEKYRSDQARVPSGRREGGQWTGEGGSSGEKPGTKNFGADIQSSPAGVRIHASAGLVYLPSDANGVVLHSSILALHELPGRKADSSSQFLRSR